MELVTARYETLAKWVNEFGWTWGAELGVSDGKTFIYLLEKCPELHMIGVDVWDNRGTVPGPTASKEVCECRYCSETRAAKKGMPIEKREAAARKGEERFRDRAVLMKMDTVEAAKWIYDGSQDFVFIDASHAENDVAADIAAWKSKVKPGGRICGHDHNMASVRAGIAEHFNGVYTEDDHLWWTPVS